MKKENFYYNTVTIKALHCDSEFNSILSKSERVVVNYLYSRQLEKEEMLENAEPGQYQAMKNRPISVRISYGARLSDMSEGTFRKAIKRLEKDFDAVRMGPRRGWVLIPTDAMRREEEDRKKKRDEVRHLADEIESAYPELGHLKPFGNRVTLRISDLYDLLRRLDPSSLR